MLDPWIIEEIRRREEEERRKQEQQPLRIELPLERRPEQDGKPADGDTPPRGVTIIDFNVG